MSITDEERKKRLEMVEKAITSIPDFPKPGIVFRDIFGVFKQPILTDYLFSELHHMIQTQVLKDLKVDAVLGLEARGFLLGPAVSRELKCAFVPLRKAGKLPGKCFSQTYDLEYGTSTIEVQCDALQPGHKVLLIDDLLATGGSLRAAIDVIRQIGAIPVASVVLIELEELNGRSKLDSVPLYSMYKM